MSRIFLADVISTSAEDFESKDDVVEAIVVAVATKEGAAVVEVTRATGEKTDGPTTKTGADAETIATTTVAEVVVDMRVEAAADSSAEVLPPSTTVEVAETMMGGNHS